MVFFISFFITIFIKTPHPIDYIKSAYFEDTKTDKIIDEYAQEKKNAKTSNSDSDNKSKNDKNEKSNDKDQNNLTAINDNNFIDFKYSTMATSHFFSKFPPNGNDIDSFA